MKGFLKNAYVILFTLALTLGAAFVATKEAAHPPYFLIRNDSGKVNISIFDAQDGNYYVFLPSYTNLDQVTAILPWGQDFFLDDVRMTNKMTCGTFELETPYEFSADGETIATLWFYQSRNVASMFIDTASGTMEQIHDDKAFEEYASLTLYAPDGTVNYQERGSKLKGRGNSTWERDKRPYVLTLSSESELLGMGRGKKWVLLANAYDETNLNNKLVFDLASQVGFSWSPDSRFVDLYLNGEYRGLYLLTEKIEIQENRLDIHTDAGDFLCRIDLPYRWEYLQNPFVTSMGQIAETVYPETMPDTQLHNIQYLVNQMEQAFQSELNLTDSGLIDLDSWVRRYLIDEISGNIDADLTSSYFYFSAGTIFGGPIWDYDKAFGNHFRNQEPHAFIAKNQKDGTDNVSAYYSVLYRNESFYQRLIEIYRSEFVPVLQEMINHGIDDQISLIQAASTMNGIRWRYMYDEWIEEAIANKVVRTQEELKDFFVRRIDFLDNAWLENKDYCTVAFAQRAGGAHWNISVEKGTLLETSYMDLEDSVWTDSQTGMPADFQSPITQDMFVILQTPEEIPTSN